MNIIRYHNQGRSDLAQTFDRFAALRGEMDRLFDGSFGPVFRTAGSNGGVVHPASGSGG